MPGHVRSPTCRSHKRDEEFQELLRSVREKLVRLPSLLEAQAFVQQTLTKQHQEHSEIMAREAAKQRALLTYVKSLEARI